MHALGGFGFARVFTCLAITAAEEIGRWLDVVSHERRSQPAGFQTRVSEARDYNVAPFKLSKSIPRQAGCLETAAGRSPMPRRVSSDRISEWDV